MAEMCLTESEREKRVFSRDRVYITDDRLLMVWGYKGLERVTRGYRRGGKGKWGDEGW